MIKLRITTAGGTRIELDIPLDDKISASSTQSAVVHHDGTVTAQEDVKSLDCEQEQKQDHDSTFESSSLKSTRREEGEGEVGEGVRGGVGEKEGEAGEGREERTCLTTFRETRKIYDAEVAKQRFCGLDEFVFPTKKGGDWLASHEVLDNLLLKHPADVLMSEFIEMRGYLYAKGLKTWAGMTRFVNNWCRNIGKPPPWEAKESENKSASVLLKSGHENSTGW